MNELDHIYDSYKKVKEDISKVEGLIKYFKYSIEVWDKLEPSFAERYENEG